MPSIEITSLPPGAAPSDIRAAWVGLQLKIATGNPKPQTFEVGSVHTRFDGWLRKLGLRLGLYRPPTEKMGGFAVEVIPAVWELEKAGHITAAKWWCENTPHLVQPRQTFIFPSSCCRVLVEDPANV